MEELVGALLEVLFEAFGEIIINAIASLIGIFAKKVEDDSVLRNRIKYTIAFIIFGLSILLLVMSLIFGKGFLASIVIVYMIVVLVINIFKYINKNIWNNSKAKIAISWVKRVVHYAFPIVLIVTGSIFLTHKDAIIWLDVLSGVALFVYLCIDIYRLSRFIERKKKEKLLESEKEENIWDRY